MKKKMTQLYYIDIWSMIDCPFQTWNIHQKIFLEICKVQQGPSWLWSYGSWIYNYLCNQCLSPLKLWVRISIRASCTLLCDKLCQWLATCRWFFPGPPVSSTNKIDHHDITETSLKVALSTIKQTNKAWHDIIIFLLLLLNTFYIELKYLWTIKVENPLYRLKKPVISIK